MERNHFNIIPKPFAYVGTALSLETGFPRLDDSIWPPSRQDDFPMRENVIRWRRQFGRLIRKYFDSTEKIFGNEFKSCSLVRNT